MLKQPKEISAIIVRQWLSEWNKVQFDAKHYRRKPAEHFYMFTMAASDLKALSGIQRRSVKDGRPRAQDLGIQRSHDQTRSDEISEFVKFGFPWSDLSTTKRLSGSYNDLRKPGWLPTAIVVNILKSGDSRRGTVISSDDLIRVEETGEKDAHITLPANYSGRNWSPKTWHPIEVIDGQHRLWAFEGLDVENSFELPVVAFYGLDISWQAYLFWTINIKPKRINTSLAFDLYPLLRTEDWLDRFEGHSIYRETRAQELTEALWEHPKSVWHSRINMLGEKGQNFVSQAAWIRSLLATFVKASEGRGVKIGGLFGAEVGTDRQALPWNRSQQAAFLIYTGQKLKESVRNCKDNWAQAIRSTTYPNLFKVEGDDDPAFSGEHSLLNADQGIRGFLYVINDCCYISAQTLKLSEWVGSGKTSATDMEAVNVALSSFQATPAAKFIDRLTEILSHYDWRSSSGPNLTREESLRKAAFRGGGGYKELRLDLLNHVSLEKNMVGAAAKAALIILQKANI